MSYSVQVDGMPTRELPDEWEFHCDHCDAAFEGFISEEEVDLAVQAHWKLCQGVM